MQSLDKHSEEYYRLQDLDEEIEDEWTRRMEENSNRNSPEPQSRPSGSNVSESQPRPSGSNVSESQPGSSGSNESNSRASESTCNDQSKDKGKGKLVEDLVPKK